MLSEKEIREKIQIDNFKHIEGMKLTMGYKEEDGYAFLIGTDENGFSYELSKIKL